jgi:hypothetical protein
MLLEMSELRGCTASQAGKIKNADFVRDYMRMRSLPCAASSEYRDRDVLKLLWTSSATSASATRFACCALYTH